MSQVEITQETGVELQTKSFPVPEGPADAVIMDPETGAIYDKDGKEFLGYADSPAEDVDIDSLVAWLSDRIGNESGRLQLLKAEKATVDEKVKVVGARVAWLRTHYLAPLREYAQRMLLGKKERGIRAGSLKLQFRNGRSSVEVVDTDKAVAWLQSVGLDKAVVIRPTVLVSEIPDDVAQDLPTDCGLVYHPAVESFEVA